MKQLKKTLLTLVALLAVTTGAWADDKKVVLKVDPITVAKGTEAEIEVKMDYTAEKTLVGLSFSLYLPDGILLKGFDTKEAQDAAKASALKKAFDINFTTGLWGAEEGAVGWFSVKQTTDGGFLINIIDQDEKTAFVNTHAPVISVYVHAVADVANVNGTINGITLTDNANNSVEQGNIADVLIPFNATAQEPESTVPLTWDATAKTATLTNGMPAGNVTVSVEYFPQAAFAMSTDATPVALAPKASTSARANTDDPLVEGGTVAGIVDGEAVFEEGQGTLLYHFSAKQLDAAALEALTAADWTDKVPTADGLAEGTVYVYYYIKGADDLPGITPGAKFTFSDSDIQELAVTLLPEPTYNVEFAEGTDPNEWSASPNTGVKKGQTVTVTYTGERKVIGVKAEKKAAPKLLEFEPCGVKFYYYEGETWGEAINNHPENAANGWSIDEDDNVMNNGQELHETNNDDNIKSDTPVNPNIGYSLG